MVLHLAWAKLLQVRLALKYGLAYAVQLLKSSHCWLRHLRCLLARSEVEGDRRKTELASLRSTVVVLLVLARECRASLARQPGTRGRSTVSLAFEAARMMACSALVGYLVVAHMTAHSVLVGCLVVAHMLARSALVGCLVVAHMMARSAVVGYSVL